MVNRDFKSAIIFWINANYGFTSDANNHIERFEHLYDSLCEGIAHFWFIKRDGSVRSAYGTLNMDIVARHESLSEAKEHRHSRQKMAGVVGYFDLEKSEWRCFKADSIKEIDMEYGLGF